MTQAPAPEEQILNIDDKQYRVTDLSDHCLSIVNTLQRGDVEILKTSDQLAFLQMGREKMMELLREALKDVPTVG